MNSLAGHKGTSLQMCNAAASCFSPEVLNFVKRGTRARVSPLDHLAKVVRRSFAHGDVSAKKHDPEELGGGEW